MKRQALVWLYVGLCVIAHGGIAQAEQGKLVWSDEFTQEGTPDAMKWTYEEGFRRNEELQFYTRRPENVRVENGMLVIEARREQYANPGFQSTESSDWRKSREHAEYTSASVTTRGIASWRYGRVEVAQSCPAAAVCGPPSGC